MFSKSKSSNERDVFNEMMKKSIWWKCENDSRNNWNRWMCNYKRNCESRENITKNDNDEKIRRINENNDDWELKRINESNDNWELRIHIDENDEN